MLSRDHVTAKYLLCEAVKIIFLKLEESFIMFHLEKTYIRRFARYITQPDHANCDYTNPGFIMIKVIFRCRVPLCRVRHGSMSNEHVITWIPVLFWENNFPPFVWRFARYFAAALACYNARVSNYGDIMYTGRWRFTLHPQVEFNWDWGGAGGWKFEKLMEEYMKNEGVEG